jgi:hypothetical protein
MDIAVHETSLRSAWTAPTVAWADELRERIASHRQSV